MGLLFFPFLLFLLFLFFASSLLLHLLPFFRVSLSHRLPSLLLCFPFRFFPFLFFFLLFLSFLQRHLIFQVDPSFLLLLLSCLFRLPSHFFSVDALSFLLLLFLLL